MNAFNRIVLLIIALLMVVIPVLLILVALGVISAGLIDQYTGYQSGLQALGGLSASAFGSTARIILAVVGAILALLALLLLLRELTFGKRVSRSTVMDDTPGRETVITASAVKALSEGAAREAGAESPSVSLATEGSSDDRRRRTPWRATCGCPRRGTTPRSRRAPGTTSAGRWRTRACPLATSKSRCKAPPLRKEGRIWLPGPTSSGAL